MSGRPLDVHLSSNPSHLEAVDPVVEGMTRAYQDLSASGDGCSVLPLLVHGDAAFAGQGVVAETLNMSALGGYTTGGTVHLVINNQLGFTTNPESARSSVYATDVAKMVQAPIFHVNGDDPEACVRVGRLAFQFRQAFHKDVVIDMVCYRRFGHNEQDDPSLTQPRMYDLIKMHRSVRKIYTETLVRRGDITMEEAEAALKDFSRRLQAALDETRATAPPRPTKLPARLPPAPVLPPIDSGVPIETLDRIVAVLHNPPEGFSVHPKLIRVFENRAKLWAGGEADWALGEALAYGSLLVEGHDVRLAGQDTRRGTFGHRNAALIDVVSGAEYIPLQHLEGVVAAVSEHGSPEPSPSGPAPGRFFVYDSLLSEYAAIGFEYGYSVVQQDALVAWEAQFGDFVNGGQIIIDQFLVSSKTKWGQTCGLTLLLPHGYEGQGAEHSSARVERFLELCAEDNIQVANPTTASQLFHLLRRQVHRDAKRPLILLTPKKYLRGPRGLQPGRGVRHGTLPGVDRRQLGCRPEHRAPRSPGLGQDGPRPDVLPPAPAHRAAGGHDPRRAAVPLAGGAAGGGAQPLPRRRRDRVGPGGAGEHGPLVVRPRQAPADARRRLPTVLDRPPPVGIAGHGQRGAVDPRSRGPDVASLRRTVARLVAIAPRGHSRTSVSGNA